jgi:type IV secretory pathway TrbD component
VPTIEDDAHYTPHLPGCPNNGIHGIVTCLLCKDMMDKPTPAAPAVSIPKQPTQPTLPSLPARSNVWQRSYGPLTGTPTAPTPVIARYSGNADVQAHNIVYTSLQRAKLLRGGEWQLSVLNNLTAAGFVMLTIMTWNWRFLLGGLFFGLPVQWLLRVLGRRDPKWWRKYRRYNQRPFIREPHGCPDQSAPPPRILPKETWFVA